MDRFETRPFDRSRIDTREIAVASINARALGLGGLVRVGFFLGVRLVGDMTAIRQIGEHRGGAAAESPAVPGGVTAPKIAVDEIALRATTPIEG